MDVGTLTTCGAAIAFNTSIETPTIIGMDLIGGSVTDALDIDCAKGEFFSITQDPILDGDVLLEPGYSIHLNRSVSIGRAYQTNPFDPDGHGGEVHIGTADTPGLYFSDVAWWGPTYQTLFDGLAITAEWTPYSIAIAGPLNTFHYSTGGLPYNRATGSWGSTPVAITPANLLTYGSIGDPSTGDIVSTLYPR